MSIKKLLLSALLLTTTGFAYAQDATKNYIKLHEDGVIVATVDDTNEGKIDLDLYNDQDWCAMQFDLYLPENVTFPERGWRTVTSRLKYYDPDEDDGLTDEAVSVADKRVFIPMAGQIESLNAAIAAAILLFPI